MRLVAGIAVASLLILAAPATAEWSPRVKTAQRWAKHRQGTVAFAVIDEHGRERGLGLRRQWFSASLLKPVLMGAYLRQRGVRSRPLRRDEQALLAPMIRSSENKPATKLVIGLGRKTIERFAHGHGLGSFRLGAPNWGSSIVTPLGYARFFRNLPGMLPARHRRYGRQLLRRIVPSQRWGIPPAVPKRWKVLLKGGWRAGSRGGRIVNQAATLERGKRRITIVVMTDGDPSHEYGAKTIEGVARRLLAGLR